MEEYILESITIYLIVCPLVFLGGFVDSIAGGGGFISLPAYIMSGLPVHMAIKFSNGHISSYI